VKRHGGESSEALRYVEVTVEDIEAANRLASEVLGTSLDELPPQTRRLLELLDRHVAERCETLGMAREDYRFTRREVREALCVSDTQLKVHLARLSDLEYLAVHPGAGRGGRYAYELVYRGEGQAGERFVLGLLDVERLRAYRYDANRSAPEPNRSGSGRPPVGGRSGGGPAPKSAASASEGRTSAGEGAAGSKTHSSGEQNPPPSYPHTPYRQTAQGTP
jgi:hypothetical protein